MRRRHGKSVREKLVLIAALDDVASRLLEERISCLWVQDVRVCRRERAALMGGCIFCKRGEGEGKSSVLSFSDLWWLKTTIQGVTQASWKTKQNKTKIQCHEISTVTQKVSVCLTKLFHTLKEWMNEWMLNFRHAWAIQIWWYLTLNRGCRKP